LGEAKAVRRPLRVIFDEVQRGLPIGPFRFAPRADIPRAPRNETAAIPNPENVPLKGAVTDAEQSELADLLKDDIWFYQEALKEYERRVSAQSVRKLFADAQPLFRSYRESVARLAVVRDPGNPERRAFDPM
jgi:hypothetical protein